MTLDHDAGRTARGSRRDHGSAAMNMTKVRRGGYIFFSWVGDHSPRHVHVYRDGQLLLKWDLDNNNPMAGNPSRKILELIRELEAEGKL